ncbi:MAG: osmotically inducible protein OsmC [Candidatus Cloacimonadota bacterium]|nr:MAG: osmotically inducible protein OsmC [Candidatus Cloacimonadota bacterium]PIE77679.1 MAG: osmotically inducible protein OsmC [Candidatus Delongbacteria bacterium]
MSIVVKFPGGKKVDAHIDNHIVKSDQPVMAGGDDSAPSPFMIFLGSLANCAGIFALSFCQQRGIDTEGLKLEVETEFDRTKGMISKIITNITLPPNFPEKYNNAIKKSVELCAVKRHLSSEIKTEINIV